MAIPQVTQGNVVELRINGEQSSGRTITTLHYMQDQVPGAGISLEGWWTAWQLWANAAGGFWERWATVVSAQWVTNTQAIQIVAPVRSPYIVKNHIQAGMAAGINEPGYVTIEFIKQTNVAGRGFSGRLYLPGVIRDHVQGDSVANASGAFLDALGAKLMENVSMAPDGGTAVPIVWSHRRPTDRHTIFRVYFNPIVKTLHRRLKGKGI